MSDNRFISKQINLEELLLSISVILQDNPELRQLFLNVLTSGLMITDNSQDQLISPSFTYGVNPTEVLVEWQPVSGATSYDIEYNIWGDVYSNIKIENVFGTSINLTNLQENRAYQVRIKPNF